MTACWSLSCTIVANPAIPTQVKAAKGSEEAIAEATEQLTKVRDAAATRKQKLQRLQHDLQLAQSSAQEAETQKRTNAKRYQSEAKAHAQQLDLLRKQLSEAEHDAELHNQKRLQAEEQATALRLEQGSLEVPASDDSILLQNLRDELAAQSADVAEARRLKHHVR